MFHLVAARSQDHASSSVAGDGGLEGGLEARTGEVSVGWAVAQPAQGIVGVGLLQPSARLPGALLESFCSQPCGQLDRRDLSDAASPDVRA